MGIGLGVVLVSIFAFLNAVVWGDGGYMVHLAGTPVSAYTLTWFWIAGIGMIYGFNYSVDGKFRHPICHIIAIWWALNLGVIMLLQAISYRGIEESGGTLFGIDVLVHDFIALGLLDIASLAFLWFLIKKGTLEVSLWMLIFCGYLVANLFGHTAGSYKLMVGVSADITAEAYDAYMYLAFTVMLVLQVLGSGTDALLRWTNTDVDLYADIRPAIRRFVARNLHLS